VTSMDLETLRDDDVWELISVILTPTIADNLIRQLGLTGESLHKFESLGDLRDALGSHVDIVRCKLLWSRLEVYKKDREKLKRDVLDARKEVKDRKGARPLSLPSGGGSVPIPVPVQVPVPVQPGEPSKVSCVKLL
jgi:hypothetical protein